MRCSKCGIDNRDGRKFCADCGAPIASVCAQCGASNEPGEKFCGECGASLAGNTPDAPSATSHIAEPSVTGKSRDPSPVPEGERKTVTALFADITGSTKMMRDLDPEEARAIIDPAIQLMIKAVHRYDGYVVQSTGDGILAVFGAPAAHEDHPQRALHAALATFDELRRAENLRIQNHAGVEVRIGINTGEVVMRLVQTGGHTEYSPIGHTINLAKRVEGAARAGGIAVSEETRRLVEGYFELRSLGLTEVKGLEEAIHVYEVLGVGALHDHFDVAAQRGLTKFVGRENELAQIRRALELAIEGKGQIVSVVAEAGTGKSRLFYEFKATLPKECKLLEAYSVSHGRATAWLPVLELLRRYFNLAAADDPVTRREKLRTTLGALDPALEDTLPYLFGLLGIVEGADPLAQMNPQIKRQRTLEAIKRIVIRESLNQPVVLIFEDLHWIDSQTQALLDLLADSIANARVLMLTNYRPEYSHLWSSKTYYSQLRLDPLGSEDGATMLATLLGESVELTPLKRLIIERTGGNPFFIEEMVQVLFDEGALIRNGVVKMTRSLSQLRLPPTVQGILAARIDRLSPENKELLQTLSVLGRESTLALINQVASPSLASNGGREKYLEPMLAELRASEFIYEQAATGGTEYVFKHALTQEVAYNSLLIERRKLLHERAGQAMESIFADQLDDHLSQLAHHYSHSDNADKAIDYLGRAGQQAMQRSVYGDAVNNLTIAIALLEKLPESPEQLQRELRLQLVLNRALSPIKGWAAPEVERSLIRAQSLCERLGNPPESFFILFGLYGANLVGGRNRRAYDLAEQMLRRAQDANDPTLLMFAHYALGFPCYQMGKLLLAQEHFETAISLYDRERHRPLALGLIGIDGEVQCRGHLAFTLWALGYPGQALRQADENVLLAQALNHPFSLVFAEQAGWVHLNRRDARAAKEHAETAIALCAEHGITELSSAATFLRGAAICDLGSFDEGIGQMLSGLAAMHAMGAGMARSNILTWLAKSYAEAGRFDDGLIALAGAEAAANENEDRQHEADRYRIKGEMLLRQNDSQTVEAENCFQQAIASARNQSAKILELRATTSLARLLRDTGRRDEARTMLAEIYNWFTEGFDTADLIDSKVLLTELSN